MTARREELLLTYGIVRVLDERYADLVEPGTVPQLLLSNMRNRPLTHDDVNSMSESILSLYHNLLTGSREFPMIKADNIVSLMYVFCPFDEEMEPDNWENATPSPFTRTPPGMLAPAAGAPIRRIFTPVIPEKADMEVLKGDRRNCVHTLESGDGSTFTRVISPVYRSRDKQLTNRWRVTNYDASGQLTMSVLCHFMRHTVQLAKSKRKRQEEDSVSITSSPSPPRKRVRV